MLNENMNATEPKTQKGKLMKEKLKNAATIVFGEKGYINTRIVDITTEANISEGNFYRYYSNKDEILVEVIDDMIEDIYHQSKMEAKTDNLKKIKLSTRSFFKSIKKHAKLYNVLVQVASFDPFFREKHMHLREKFNKNVRRSFENQIMITDVELDYAASAIVSMIQQTAYTWCVVGEGKEFDLEVLSDVVSNIWLNSIQMFQEKNDE